MKHKLKTKKAFTLAELTIAISIVGVLAAIVVPAVHNLAPNKEMIMFKKAYGEFVRITNEMINNDDLYPESFDGSRPGFANYSKVTYRGVEAEGAEKFCILFATHVSTKGEPNCRNSKWEFDFETQDGVLWKLPSNIASTGEVIIDVNGYEDPNCPYKNSCENKDTRDQFLFKIDHLGRIIIEDEVAQAYLSETDLTKSKAEIESEL